MTTRRATCKCEKLALVCEGEPVRVGICHCLDCQKRTGSAFGVQARFAKERVVRSGEAREYSRVGDDGGRITFSFCPTCGSTVFYVCEEEPELVGVPVGGFADPTFPAPTYSVYEHRRHAWVREPEGIEHW